MYQSVSAGIDMHMHGPKFFDPLRQLVTNHRISEARIDAAVRPILLAKFRLGLFESAQVDLSDVKTVMFNKEHQQTALQLARQGIVLLKNDANTLPLSAGARVFVRPQRWQSLADGRLGVAATRGKHYDDY